MNGLFSQTGYASPETFALQAEFCATGVQSSICMCPAQEHKRKRNSKHKYASDQFKEKDDLSLRLDYSNMTIFIMLTQKPRNLLII